jgi:diphthine-ammonia ligase
MIAAGIHAVLVKTAAAGLLPRRHLGRSLEEMRPTLWGLREVYGGNICGEGGEYETLTLDCPAFR